MMDDGRDSMEWTFSQELAKVAKFGSNLSEFPGK